MRSKIFQYCYIESVYFRFLNDIHSSEYKLYKNLVEKYKCEIEEKERESQIRPEDKYEPEFSLQDDSDYEDNLYKDNAKEKFEKKDTESEKSKKRKSRWSEAPAEPSSSSVGIPGVATVVNLGGMFKMIKNKYNYLNCKCNSTGIVNMQIPPVQEKTQISKMSRTDPQLLHYAVMNYGSSTLTEEQWKKCEDHYKINILYQVINRVKLYYFFVL